MKKWNIPLFVNILSLKEKKVCYCSWGMGTNGQLGTGEDDDVWSPNIIK